MRHRPFLTIEEIKELQIAEEQSTKEQKRTPEQIEAIYSSGSNMLVSASAGSGKTFVMVQRILDQLQRGVSINQLFISTFTVKAATELKERLEKELGKTLKETRDEELKHHLAQQIAELATADIGTMDSFTQKVLGNYGYLLGLSPNYRILQNESEQRIIQNEVFTHIFNQYYDGTNSELFKKMVKNFTGKSKSLSPFRQQVYHIYTFLQSTSDPEQFLSETFLKGYEEIDYDAALVTILKRGSQVLFELESFLRHHLETTGKEFSKAKYQDHVLTILDEIASLNELSSSEDYKQTLMQVVGISRLSNGRALTITTRKEELKALASEFNEERKQLIEQLRGLEKELYTLEFLRTYHDDSLQVTRLLRDFVLDFSRAYLERKKQENAFEFGDISHFAIQILEKFPEVRHFYQYKYHEVMVDEYQDTNHTQEKMLELLSRDSNRFMVGDIKQSIYRFRQADPQIFNEKFQRYQADPSQGRLIILKENFRSHVEVLEATNDVFKRLMDKEVGEINYDGLHFLVAGNPEKQEPNPVNKTEFLLYDSGADTEENQEVDSSVETISSGEIDLVIKEIIRLHNEEGVAFEDITLLTASRTRNDLILSAFENYHIPIVADDGEKHYLQSVEVMLMLDTLRTINNPLNDYALTALLRSPMFQFEEDELARISLQKAQQRSKEYLYEKLQNSLEDLGLEKQLISPDLRKKLLQFDNYLQSWRRFSKTHSLYDLIWKIYQDRLYYDYVGALPNGAQRQANLYALALRAHEFEKANFKGLSRFIQMINKVLENDHDLASVVVAAPQHAVNLMTIHKSKGLEFPYVFLLNMDKAFNKQDSNAACIISRQNGIGLKYVADVFVGDKDPQSPHQVRVVLETLPYKKNQEESHLAHLSEQMRLLYVAMTRAEKKLYLVGKANREKLNERDWKNREEGRLSMDFRRELTSFQDWLYAIQEAFHDQELAYDTKFVTPSELTREKIGYIRETSPILEHSLAHNRPSDDIKRALDILANVDRLNTLYKPAIELPSVRTPSQIKKFYEPIMDQDGVEVMEKRQRKAPSFDLPDFVGVGKVSSAEVGSATHELMQRISLESEPTVQSVEETLSQMQLPDAIKKKIAITKIVAFFQTSLGKLLLEEKDHVYREAPFAMLKQDEASGENFVVRGILDGYVVLEDRIVLFDYKTDSYQESHQLVERYRDQLSLYSEALSRSYQISKVEKFLVLLGGENIQVVEVV